MGSLVFWSSIKILCLVLRAVGVTLFVTISKPSDLPVFDRRVLLLLMGQQRSYSLSPIILLGQ